MRPLIVAFALCLMLMGTSGCQREVVLVSASATIPKTNSKVVSVAELCDILNSYEIGTNFIVVMTKKYMDEIEPTLKINNPNQQDNMKSERTTLSDLEYCVVYATRPQLLFFKSSHLDDDVGSDYFIVQCSHVSNDFLVRAYQSQKDWRSNEVETNRSHRSDYVSLDKFVFNHMIKLVKKFDLDNVEASLQRNQRIRAWRDEFTQTGSINVAVLFKSIGKVHITNNVLSFATAMEEVKPMNDTYIFQYKVED